MKIDVIEDLIFYAHARLIRGRDRTAHDTDEFNLDPQSYGSCGFGVLREGIRIDFRQNYGKLSEAHLLPKQEKR